jgi:hypothetical protein
MLGARSRQPRSLRVIVSSLMRISPRLQGFTGMEPNGCLDFMRSLQTQAAGRELARLSEEGSAFHECSAS